MVLLILVIELVGFLETVGSCGRGDVMMLILVMVSIYSGDW